MVLEDEYLFAYFFNDGFTNRILRAHFVVGYDYHYTLELNAFFDYKTMTKNNSNNLIEKGKLSEEQLAYIEDLFFADLDALKKHYQYECRITDIGFQQILINPDITTKCIDINGGLPIEYFETPIEKKLFELNEYFKNFIEARYDNWLVK